MNRRGGAVPVPPPVEHALVVPDSVARPETLPAASFASTPSVCDVLHVNPENALDNDVVGPVCVPSMYVLYPVTATLSVDAFHVSVSDVCAVLVILRLLGVDG